MNAALVDFSAKSLAPLLENLVLCVASVLGVYMLDFLVLDRTFKKVPASYPSSRTSWWWSSRFAPIGNCHAASASGDMKEGWDAISSISFMLQYERISGIRMVSNQILPSFSL